MNIIDMLPITHKKKVTVGRDDYRHFEESMSKLEGLNVSLPHMVTHNKEEDTFTVELLDANNVNLEELDKLIEDTKFLVEGE
jgi:hypothetical protein